MTISSAVQICLVMFFAVLTAGADVPSPAPAVQTNALVWDALEKSADLPAMTNIAYFTFWVTNMSAAEATILSTETSCDCTVAEAAKILPWHIKPGDGGPLKVHVNTRGKFGLVTKTITVQTSQGAQVLTINVKIPFQPAPFNVSMRKRDQMAAQTDRQSVFRDHCAVCHTYPALAAHTGQELFETACGICHTAEHRAEMVPDLAKLNRDTRADYWRTNVTFGKPGSLMPAFAKSEGGILETNQIEMLIEYLIKTYPPKTAAIPAGVNIGKMNAHPSPASQTK